MSFFDKIEDVTIVDMFKWVFQWRNSKELFSAQNQLLRVCFLYTFS